MKNWFKWLLVRFRHRKLTIARNRAAKAKRELARSMLKLSDRKREMESLLSDMRVFYQRLEAKAISMEDDLNNAERNRARSEESLDHLRHELEVHESTITALVAQNRLLLNRWEAESSVQVRRQTLAGSAGSPGME